jgi:hypothetical protein
MSALNFIDLTGQVFVRLTVIERVEDGRGWAPRWRCRCECGNERIVYGVNLREGRSQSCGCLHRERAAQTKIWQGNVTHGGTHTPEYSSWEHMVQRVTNPRNDRFQHYGGRGITICDEWRNSKPSPKHSIDRINNDGNYEPGNVRWATAKEQGNNQRRPPRRSQNSL